MTKTIMLQGIQSSQVLHAQIFAADGITPIGDPITTGFVDVGSNTYAFTYDASIAIGIIKFYNASNAEVLAGIIKSDDCNDQAPCTNVAGGAGFSSEILLVKGDSYTVSNGRAIVYNVSNVPNLTGSNITLTANSYADGSVAINALAVTLGAFAYQADAENNAQLTIEFPSNVTSNLTNVGYSAYSFKIVAALADSSTVTLARGLISLQ